MPTPTKAFVSIIVPCRNEAQHVGRCLQSVLDGDYPPDRMEILVVDGRSDDRTREIVTAYAARYPTVRLLHNARRITPVALNLAVRAAQGDLVMRLDAHVAYQRDYVTRVVQSVDEI